MLIRRQYTGSGNQVYQTFKHSDIRVNCPATADLKRYKHLTLQTANNLDKHGRIRNLLNRFRGTI